MRPALNIENQKFGKVTAISPTNGRSYGYILWNCICDCGNKFITGGAWLKSGNTKSCGCVKKEKNSNRLRTHGLSRTRGYRNLQEGKRRALKKDSSADITIIDLKDILEYYNFQCVYRGGEYQHLDHITPLSRGGSHSKDNLVPACQSCNNRKFNKLLWEEWTPPINILNLGGYYNSKK